MRDMIKGYGIDIVEIGRIERLVDRYGPAFVDRVYTAAEALYCRAVARPAARFAGRWAAKEAFYKALPESCQRVAGWKSIEMLGSERSGRPEITVLSSGLREAMEKEGIAVCHVSVSHEREHCVVAVILESGEPTGRVAEIY